MEVHVVHRVHRDVGLCDGSSWLPAWWARDAPGYQQSELMGAIGLNQGQDQRPHFLSRASCNSTEHKIVLCCTCWCQTGTQKSLALKLPPCSTWPRDTGPVCHSLPQRLAFLGRNTISEVLPVFTGRLHTLCPGSSHFTFLNPYCTLL